MFSQLIVVGFDRRYPTLEYLGDDMIVGPQFIVEADGMTSVYSTEHQMAIKALREARVAGRIIQEELGKALGRPQSPIAKVEDGERRLDIAEFAHLCRLVGIDLVSIINKLQY